MRSHSPSKVDLPLREHERPTDQVVGSSRFFLADSTNGPVGSTQDYYTGRVVPPTVGTPSTADGRGRGRDMVEGKCWAKWRDWNSAVKCLGLLQDILHQSNVEPNVCSIVGQLPVGQFRAIANAMRGHAPVPCLPLPLGTSLTSTKNCYHDTPTFMGRGWGYFPAANRTECHQETSCVAAAVFHFGFD